MKKVLLVVALTFLVSAGAFAQEATEEGPQYTVFTKLGRGLGNIIKSPFEIPVTLVNVGADTDVFVGASAGTVAGLAAGIERLCAGVVEVITSPFPPYDRALLNYEVGKSPAAAAAVATFPKPDEF